jgi:proteasome endopeptidase complex, beta component (EC 3.4.25.1). Threonine peptidase. MEROPS family T01A
MPIEAAATLLSNILNQSKYYPYMVQLIVAGYDTSPHIFSIDAAGGAVRIHMSARVPVHRLYMVFLKQNIPRT